MPECQIYVRLFTLQLALPLLAEGHPAQSPLQFTIKILYFRPPAFLLPPLLRPSISLRLPQLQLWKPRIVPTALVFFVHFQQ